MSSVSLGQGCAPSHLMSMYRYRLVSSTISNSKEKSLSKIWPGTTSIGNEAQLIRHVGRPMCRKKVASAGAWMNREAGLSFSQSPEAKLRELSRQRRTPDKRSPSTPCLMAPFEAVALCSWAKAPWSIPPLNPPPKEILVHRDQCHMGLIGTRRIGKYRVDREQSFHGYLSILSA